MAGLVKGLRKYKAGQKVEITVNRGKEKLKAQVTLGKSPTDGATQVQPELNSVSTQYLHQIALANAEVMGKQFSVAEAILKKCPPDLRRWEWHYLKRLSNPQLAQYRERNTGMWGVEFSPDGSMVASGGFSEVHLWNARTGKRLHLWKPKKGWVSSVAFSKDGKRLASASSEGNIWDTESGKQVANFEAHEWLAYCIDFSPDGKFVATGGNSAEAEFATKGSGVTKIWNAKTGKLHRQLYQDIPVMDLEYSPDGNWIAAVSGKSVYTQNKHPAPLNIWDANTGELVHKLEGHNVFQSCLAFSPNGQRLVVGGNDGNVRIWNLMTRKLTHVMSGHKRHLTGVEFTPDGSKILSTADDTEVRLWDAGTGKLIEVIAGPRGKISGLSISPDGRSFVTAVEFGKERGAKVWKLHGNNDVPRKGSGQCIALSPDGKTYAVGSHPKDDESKSIVRIRQSATHATIQEWELEYPLRVRDLDFSPDGKRLLASGDNGFSLWNLESNEAEFTVPIYGIDITYASAYGPDGSTIVVRESMYDARTGKKMFTLGLKKWPGQKNVTGVDYSVDGKQVATANWGGFDYVYADGKKEARGGHVTIWDAATGKEQLYVPGGGYGVVFSQDGSGIITGDDQGRLIRFDTKTGQKVWSTQAHASGVLRVAKTPDGSRLVSIGKDRAARLWDPETGAQVLVLHGLSMQGMSVAAGKHNIGVACEDGGLHLWDGRPTLGD